MRLSSSRGRFGQGRAARTALAAFACALAVACAARRPLLDPSLAGRAEALVREGCYDCLLDARDIYARLVADRRVATAATRLFEVHLLLALREKELALDPADAITRARALVPSLPAAADAARYLEVVEIVPADERGEPKTLRGPFLETMMRPQFRARSLGWVMQGALDPVVKEYIALAVECVRPTLSDRTVPPPKASAPILTFRRAICPATPDTAALEQLRVEVPRFVEAGLFVARGMLFGQGDAVFSVKSRTAANAHLDDVRRRFAASPAITYELGVLAQVDGDLRRAAGHYGDTLALRPEHEDARLSRAMAFTYLNDPEAAVADATTLIESGAYNRGEAYYWRAFNRHRAKDLVQARADIEQAKSLASSSRVLTLAGMIEHDQKELEIATRDLVEAVRLDSTNCVARWYLGVVRHALEEWTGSGAAFADAARCYDLSAARSERSREEMAQRAEVDEEFRARQLAGFDAAIKEDRTQESASALNAAIGYARGGDRATAERYLDQAAKDPARRLMVADLRQVMRGPQ
jgi:tetratricopeptide (TPR) repeat protein